MSWTTQDSTALYNIHGWGRNLFEVDAKGFLNVRPAGPEGGAVNLYALMDDLVVRGIEYMTALAEWYGAQVQETPIGFFQIGGGIAGDFAICAVPAMIQDLDMEDIPFWGYFCQISDAVTSYGGYSGAPPNEKITWGKLDIHTPKFMIESDATIVAPLIFGYLLGW